MKLYSYKKCSTCQKAIKYCDLKNIKYTEIPIIDQPPSLKELTTMLNHLKKRFGSEQGLKKLLNTSGELYRELGIAQKLKDGISEAELLKLLSENGKLIKRPFMLSSSAGTVGFDAEVIDELFSH